MKLDELKTPCYVIDIGKLKKNLELLKNISEKSGCKILLAQKAFSNYALYPLIGGYINGCCASSLNEARLSREEMGLETHIFAAAYREGEFTDIASRCDHVVFNSPNELLRFKDAALSAGCAVGLRVNPCHSTQSGGIYDPCAPMSRLGTTRESLLAALSDNPNLLSGVSGLHFHTLCEQDSDALESTLEAVLLQFGEYLEHMEWLNFGGGHHITREGYDIERLVRCIERARALGLEVYLEPGEAVALNAGYLLTSVLDTIENGIPIAILDASAACHMPDVIEMPYRPPLEAAGQAGEKQYTYRLGGPTCLAGDIIGDYSFDKPLKCGDRLKFLDMAIYTMVKNNTFNGINLPSIAFIGESGECALHKTFGYDDFKARL